MVVQGAAGTTPEAGDKRHQNGRHKLAAYAALANLPEIQNVLECVDGSPEEIAHIFMLAPDTLRRVRRLNGYDPETGLPEPDERIIELVERHKAGQTVRELAEVAGVSKSTMARVLAGTGRLPFNAADLGEITARDDQPSRTFWRVLVSNHVPAHGSGARS